MKVTWIEALVAFGGPFFLTAGSTFAASGRDWAVTLFAAFAAGFGGLGARLGNDWHKAKEKGE